jgi:ribosomal protein S18 acetylase RimI-like enzyme
MNVQLYAGARARLRPLFELADDSAQQLDGYLEAGRVLVATLGDAVIGHVQLVETERPAELEIKNLAVLPAHEGRGVGRALVEAAAAHAREEGRATLVVSTAAAGTGVLRFYQRVGFRMASIDRDAFTPETGYASGTEIDGIPLRDRVWLDRGLD